MSALSRLIEGEPQDQRTTTYDALAEAVIAVFGVSAGEVTFLGHNSGAAFRVETADHGRLLLKVHAPQGDSEPLSAPAVRGGLEWLADMAELTETPVQEPLQDRDGALLPTVEFRGLLLPCSLQHWIEGHQVDELSIDQAHGVGALMGRWHTFSERHGTDSEDAVRVDSRYLDRALDSLHVVSTLEAVADTWQPIEQATSIAASLIEGLGTAPDVFGVVHGDLGPDNVIVSGNGTVRFIDLAQLALAPYLWDLGTALYQYSYQDTSVRTAILAGYRGIRPGQTIPPLALEAFVCAAALDNLAFQCSIPAQRTSPLFQTNMRRFATGYCRDLVQGVPFAVV